jgi:exodeoxyribonuclease-1
VAIFAEAEPFVPSENVDAQLYNGFFSDADRAAMNIVLETEPRNSRRWISPLPISASRN